LKELECIAGEKGGYETTHTEEKIKFKVDLRKVYWGTNLASERNRIITSYLTGSNVKTALDQNSEAAGENKMNQSS